MPAFGLTPVSGFPPASPDTFPQGIQFQLEGEDVGDRTVDTVNFVAGDALAMSVGSGESSGILTITIPVANVSGT